MHIECLSQCLAQRKYFILGNIILEKSSSSREERVQAVGSDTLGFECCFHPYCLDNFARYITAQVDKYKP